jgi:hypothetical protein
LQAVTTNLGQKRPDIFCSKSRYLPLAYSRVKEGPLLRLKRKYPLLHRIPGNESVNQHRIHLTDPIRSIRGLILHRGIPPRIKDVYVIGGRKVKANTTRLKR